jgi:hypothetical protein
LSGTRCIDKGININLLAIGKKSKPTYIYNDMSTTSIHYEKVNQGYNVSINRGEMNHYSSRDDTWNTIYNAVKDTDFTTQAVEFRPR